MRGAYAAVADPLIWLVVPGAAEGAGQLHEDDGVSVAHRYGQVLRADRVSTAP